MTKNLLLIEDDADLAHIVELHLRDAGYEVEVVHDGDRGLEAACRGGHALIVLDWMLPGADGLEICRRMRQRPEYTPILMLTAKSSEIDRVLGLEVGADDYLTKPFSVRELVARVKAILRRVEALSQTTDVETLRVGEIEIEIEKRRATLAGEPLHLTSKEFDLLTQFARQPGRVYSRAELLDLVWGYAHGGYEHTVNTHINRLRNKIEANPAEPRYILTVWGVGYKLGENGP